MEQVVADRDADRKINSSEPADQSRPAVSLARGLSGKLLVLTVLFVLVAEVLIFIPSVANFRLNWLRDRLDTAAAASVVLAQTDISALSRKVQDEVLMATDAKAIAIRDKGLSRLLVVSEMPPAVDEHIDLAGVGVFASIRDALATLVRSEERILRVFGPVGADGRIFELVVPSSGLRDAMLVYSRNVALLSLLISLITAGLVFSVLNRMLIKPIRDMTRSMLAFGAAPDDPGRIIVPDSRRDEIGVAERELATMQKHLQQTLGERKRLADLGLAVSKINHDMRNILASAQLMSDRLTGATDPRIQSFAPKLIRTLDRAVGYTRDVLEYGRTQEEAPTRRRLRLRLLVDEVFELLGIPDDQTVELKNLVDPDVEIDADNEQMFRVLANLCRNAIQAMAVERESAVVRRLSVSADRVGAVCRILVTDTGPGLPPKARENLFAAFRGSARAGGTGLGLAIALELVRAHGGEIELVESTGGKTVFAVTIPDQPVNLDAARTSMRKLG